MFKAILFVTAVLLLMAGFLFAENRLGKKDNDFGTVVIAQVALFSMDRVALCRKRL